MIDFPNSPTNGQTFTSVGLTWRYDGAKWVVAGGTSPYQIGPGLALNTGTVPPTIDVATPYLPLLGGVIAGSPGTLTINTNTAAAIAPMQTGNIAVFGADNANVAVELTGSNQTPVISSRRSAGTLAVPSPTLVNTSLLNIQGRGRGTTGWSATPRGVLVFQSSETWTDTAQGTQLQISTTPLGTAANVGVAYFGQGLTLGTPPAVGVDTARGSLICNANTIAPITLPGGEQVLVQGGDLGVTPAKIDFVSFGTNCGFNFYRGNNTAASPTAIGSGNIIARMGLAGGYDGAAWQFQTVRLDTIATETWSGTARGTALLLNTTPTGSTTLVQSMYLSSGVLIGQAGAPSGVGTLIVNANPNAMNLVPGSTAGGQYLMIHGNDGGANNVMVQSYGGNPNLQFVRAQGTATTPFQVLSNLPIGRIGGGGYYVGATSGWAVQHGQVQFTATENWTDVGRGTKIDFITTPTGSVSAVVCMTLDYYNLTVSGGISAYNLSLLTGDLFIARTDQAVGYVVRPNTAGYKNLKMACAGDTSLDSFAVNALNSYFNGAVQAQLPNGSFIGMGTGNNNSGQLRLSGSNSGVGYGSMLRQDTGNLYILLTNNNDAFGTYNALRPLYCDCSTGNLTMNHNITMYGSVMVGSATGGQKGNGNLNAVVLWSNGVVVSSDAQFKRDIEPLPSCLDLVMAIAPKMFRFNEPPPPEGPDAPQDYKLGPPGFWDKRHWGFIAQDVAEVMRDQDFGGHEIGEDGTEALSVVDMLAVLWKAVQELKAEIRRH